MDIILFAGLVVLIGYLANIFSEYTKIPESLFMIIIGVLIGPVFGLVDATHLREIAGTFATIAIIIILIDSGMDFDIRSLFKKMLDASIFTIIVNLLITITVGFFVHLVFGWNLLHGFLLGVVSSGTTTVMVQSLLEGLEVNQETKHLLVLESILNDTTLIMIAISLIGIIKQQSGTILSGILTSLKNFIIQFSLGFLFSGLFFFLWVEIIQRIPTKKKKNYVFLLGLLFILYGITDTFGGSGIVAVLFFALFLGNQSVVMDTLNLKKRYFKRSHSESLKSIQMIQLDISFFIRTFFFVFLGLIVDVEILTFDLLALAFSIIGIMVVTRFISVKIISLLDKKYSQHTFLISTMVPRGFVATLLAFLPFKEGIIIPKFPEVVILLIFTTSLVSIVGNIIYRAGK